MSVSDFRAKLQRFKDLQMELAVLKQIQEYLRDFVPSDARPATKHISFCDNTGITYVVQPDALDKVLNRINSWSEEITNEVEQI